MDGRLQEKFPVQSGVNCLHIAGIVHLFEFCAGRVLHADDERTLATSEASLQAQVAMVNQFVTSNSLHLNLTKCKTVIIRTREWPS